MCSNFVQQTFCKASWISNFKVWRKNEENKIWTIEKSILMWWIVLHVMSELKLKMNVFVLYLICFFLYFSHHQWVSLVVHRQRCHVAVNCSVYVTCPCMLHVCSVLHAHKIIADTNRAFLTTMVSAQDHLNSSPYYTSWLTS